jgi:multiple antibiotic resistance protein
MHAVLTHIANDFITLIVVVDPFGTVLPTFLALTADCKPELKRKLAIHSVLIAFLVMLFFIAFAQIVTEAIGLSLRSFEIAGGIVLLLFAISLVLGSGPTVPVEVSERTNYKGLAVFPLAIPAISGPGTMLTAMLITDNDRFSVFEKAQTALAGTLVLAITLVLLLLADPVYRAIGSSGTNVVRRIMGMILAAVALNMMFSGVASWLGLPKF